jgi:predicted deacylase
MTKAITRGNEMIEAVTLQATQPGPALLVFGAIHGNEICGPKAIAEIIDQFRSGKLTLEKGSVTFVPVANTAAYNKNLRFKEENLNRIFRPTKHPASIEARLANQLCRMVDRCDILLDLHSTTAEGKPFIYLDFPTPKNRAFAKVLGPKFAITGWPELYKKWGKKHLSFDTPTYAASKGKDVLLIECGQHLAPAAVPVAYNAILQALRHYGLVKGAVKRQKLIEIKIDAGYFRDHAKDRLVKKWRHLDTVKAGEALIHKADGTLIKAPGSAYVIMPKPTAPVDDDWLYLGHKV